MRGGRVVLDASASSQFISALLLAGSLFDEGVTVVHDGKPLPSLPHIEMTVEALRDALAGTETRVAGGRTAVIEAAAMTQIPAFTAMVQYKNYRPMHLGLTPWWTRADAGVLKEDQMRAYQLCGKMQAPTMDNWGVTSDGTVNYR